MLRNTLGCGFGFTPLAEVGGSRDYFEDAEVAPGVTYYYSVQPVGANPSCYGLASNCVAITPEECAAPGLPAPGGVTLDAATPNQVGVSWNPVAGAGSYKVLRRDGGCAAGGPERAVGAVAAPATAFTDADGIAGGGVYGYRVAASDAACASCAGAASACVEVEATGTCELAPLFDGIGAVVSATSGTCGLTVSWSAGSARCGASLTYDVHRSTEPGFAPGPANRVAEGVAGTSYTDLAVAGGGRFFYVVRARDSFGNTDGNTVRMWEEPVGELAPGSFADDAGDTGPAALHPSFTAPSSWAVRAGDAGGGNPTAVYATSAAGNYPDNACAGLDTPTLRLGADPTLTFRTRYDLEQGWDGGIVQVATEGSGFTDWTRLDSVPYPGVMGGPLGDPACGIPEFDDLEPVFTGTSIAWEPLSATLSDYAGQAVRLRFLFSSDGSTNQAGWLLDDLVIDDVLVGGECVPAAPVASPDVVAVSPHATPVTIAVLGNDLDPAAGGLSVIAVTQPARGSAAIDSGGPGPDTVTYTAGLNGCPGPDGFTYTVEDALGNTAVGTVELTLLPDLPFADGFESGDAAAWCSAVGIPPPP